MTNTDQADALKPCPFCGRDRIQLNQSAAPRFWHKCIDCGCEGPNRDTGVAAHEAWNTRAPEPEGERACIHCGEAENAHSAGGMLKCPEYHKGPFWTWRDTVFTAAPTAQPEAEPTGEAVYPKYLKPNPGDWPGDFKHENGCYFCRCGECNSQFYGHKRRVTCKVCAEKAEQPTAGSGEGEAEDKLLRDYDTGRISRSHYLSKLTAATSAAEQALRLERDRLKDAQEVAERAEQALREANEKLTYVHSMGLRFGMMKTSDKPEPYLQHEWTEDSDHERMFREWTHSIGWQEKLAAAERAKAQAEQERDGYKREVENLTSHCNELDRQVTRNRENWRMDAEDKDRRYYKLTREVAEAREALRAALIPLAVLKIGQQTKPYAEHTATLTAEIAWAHDAVYAALLKAREGKA